MIGIPKHPSENSYFIQNICVYIVNHLQTEYILLTRDSCHYEGFFVELLPKRKDNEIELKSKELLSSLISVMDTE